MRTTGDDSLRLDKLFVVPTTPHPLSPSPTRSGVPACPRSWLQIPSSHACALIPNPDCSVKAPNSYKKSFTLTHASGREVQCDLGIGGGQKEKPFTVCLSRTCLPPHCELLVSVGKHLPPQLACVTCKDGQSCSSKILLSIFKVYALILQRDCPSMVTCRLGRLSSTCRLEVSVPTRKTMGSQASTTVVRCARSQNGRRTLQTPTSAIQ